MSLESTQTAMEAERYWGEEITRKQSYRTSEGYTDSGRYLSPMRYLNPQRSKNLQDRKGWIEGWEPRIKADEFIHGLGIGEAYLRHNARPAKVKLIRADINPPGDFDLSEDLPRFSQGNEPPLNLTEKVNRVVMDRMRAARKKPEEDTRNAPEAGEDKRKKRKGKPKPSQTSTAQQPTTAAKNADTEITNQVSEPEHLDQSIPTPSAKQIDPSLPKSFEASTETSHEYTPKADSRRRRDKLEWYGTWEEE
jgi:hypothetical protein